MKGQLLIDSEVADYRRRRDGTREDQRAALRNQATEARGHEIFRAGDSTSLESTNLAEGLTAIATDRSVPVAESAKQLFVDPATGDFYSAKALKRLFSTNIPLVKTMLRTDTDFMNLLLNAK